MNAAVAWSACQPTGLEMIMLGTDAQVPIIRGAVDSYAADLGSSHARLVQLRRDIERMSSRLSNLETLVRVNRRQVLLGESAYMLDRAACSYIMQGSTVAKRTTIGELRMRAYHKDLTAEQMTRWDVFITFIKKCGWSIGDVCTTSFVIKEMRKEVAHSTDVDKSNVTLEELQEWIVDLPKDVRDDCRKFLQLVARFGTDGKPLVMVKDVESAMDAATF